MPTSLLAVAIAAICDVFLFCFVRFFLYFRCLHLLYSRVRSSNLSFSLLHRIVVRVAVGQARALSSRLASVLKVGTRFVTQKLFALVSIFFLGSSAPSLGSSASTIEECYVWLVPVLCVLHPLFTISRLS